MSELGAKNPLVRKTYSKGFSSNGELHVPFTFQKLMSNHVLKNVFLLCQYENVLKTIHLISWKVLKKLFLSELSISFFTIGRTLAVLGDSSFISF
jgi:hypothetical protein